MTASAKKAEDEENLNHEESGNTVLFPDRQEIIAELAYYKAERRGFLPGYELQDWIEAEKELGLN